MRSPNNYVSSSFEISLVGKQRNSQAHVTGNWGKQNEMVGSSLPLLHEI